MPRIILECSPITPLWGGVGGGGRAILSQLAHRNLTALAPPQPSPARGEGADRVCRTLLIPTSGGDSTGARKSARATSRPGVAAAVEEAVLVVVRGGLAVRLDGADLGERGLHRGALVDGVEPAREIGIVFPFHALGVVVARPWIGRDIGDGVLLAAEVGHLAEPRLQHLVEALYFRGVAAHRIVAAALGREQL